MSVDLPARHRTTATPSARPATRQRRRRPNWLVPAVTFAGLVLIQELVARSGVLSSESFPPASIVAASLVEEITSGDLGSALLLTVRTWFIALILAIMLGGGAGLALGASRVADAILRPIIDFLRPIPSVALIPLVVLTIGTSFSSGVFLAVFAAFWQVLIPVVDGARTVDPVAADTARTYRFTRAQRIRWLQLPHIVPYLMTAVRLAASTTLILAVTAELIIGIDGLGQEIALSRVAGDLPRMYAYIAATGAAGMALNALMRLTEQRLTRSFPPASAIR